MQLTLAALALAPRAATAAPPEEPASTDPAARARLGYERGSAAYAEARFEDALLHFQAASALAASPDFVFNIALCHEQLEHFAEAARAFEAYLAASPDAADEAAVRARIERLRRLSLRPVSPPVLGPAEPAPTSDPAPTRPTEPQRRTKASGPLLGVGIAGIVSGLAIAGAGAAPTVEGVQLRRQLDRVNAGNPDERTAPEVRKVLLQARRAATSQAVLFSTGGALVAIGATLVIVGARRRSRARVGVVATPRAAGITLRGTF